MQEERYYVGSYWGARKETAHECARRAEHFFELLKQCDPLFGQWYRGGRGAPRAQPGFPVLPEAKDLEALFLKTRPRTDVGKKVIEDMGFGEMFWNAKLNNATQIHLACGGYSPFGSPNVCLVYPPASGMARESFLTVPFVAKVLTCVVKAWDPVAAMATSTELNRLVEKNKREVRVGWLTYLSRQLGTLPPLPAPVRIEPVGTQGWLLVLSPERMSAHQPEHVAFTARVRELLDRAGLIQPMYPRD